MLTERPKKDPRRVAGGHTGARKRWGPQRVVRIDSLDPITASIIRAILTARENAAKAASDPDKV